MHDYGQAITGKVKPAIKAGIPIANYGMLLLIVRNIPAAINPYIATY